MKKRRSPLVVFALFASVAATVGVLSLRQPIPERPAEARPRGRARHAAVEFDRFSARRERSSEGERLSVSLRLRSTVDAAIDCFVFVVAHNDRVTPRLWSIWPPQPPTRVITSGGHFHGATPTAGHPLTLEQRWQRVTATVPRASTATFDTVVIYVLSPEGRVLLARPFRV